MNLKALAVAVVLAFPLSAAAQTQGDTDTVPEAVVPQAQPQTPQAQTGQQTQPGPSAPESGNFVPLSEPLIRNIQQALNQRGFNVGTVDGQYDAQTQQALREFQSTRGIEANGQIDQQTAMALGVQTQTETPVQETVQPQADESTQPGLHQPQGGPGSTQESVMPAPGQPQQGVTGSTQESVVPAPDPSQQGVTGTTQESVLPAPGSAAGVTGTTQESVVPAPEAAPGAGESQVPAIPSAEPAEPGTQSLPAPDGQY